MSASCLTSTSARYRLQVHSRTGGQFGYSLYGRVSMCGATGFLISQDHSSRVILSVSPVVIHSPCLFCVWIFWYNFCIKPVPFSRLWLDNSLELTIGNTTSTWRIDKEDFGLSRVQICVIYETQNNLKTTVRHLSVYMSYMQMAKAHTPYYQSKQINDSWMASFTSVWFVLHAQCGQWRAFLLVLFISPTSIRPLALSARSQRHYS